MNFDDVDPQVILWIGGNVTELKSLGLMWSEGGLTGDSLADFRRLQLTGYRPTKEESMPVIQQLFGDQAEAAWAVIIACLDDLEGFLGKQG